MVKQNKQKSSVYVTHVLIKITPATEKLCRNKNHKCEKLFNLDPLSYEKSKRWGCSLGLGDIKNNKRCPRCLELETEYIEE